MASSSCPGVDGLCSGRRTGLRNSRLNSVSAGGVLCKDCEALTHANTDQPEPVPSQPVPDNSAGGPVHVFDAVLCYIANVRNSSKRSDVSVRNSSRRSDVSHVVANYFSVDAIDTAKNVCGTIVRKLRSDL